MIYIYENKNNIVDFQSVWIHLNHTELGILCSKLSCIHKIICKCNIQFLLYL